jgi:HYR domain
MHNHRRDQVGEVRSMFRRLVRRSTALAAAAALLSSGAVLADTVAADGDTMSGIQSFVDLGTVGPGAVIDRDVTLTLFCGNSHHVDPDQLVVVSQGGVTIPQGGSLEATSVTIGPVPGSWANDTTGTDCSEPLSVEGSTPSHVTITAPDVPGIDYAYTLFYDRTLTPPGIADSSSVSSFTVINFILDVEDGPAADTTPPVMTGLPGDMELVTGDPTGVLLEYALPTATDDVDLSPVVACDPAPGSVVPLGTTAVDCVASDASGNEAAGSFGVVVHLATVEWGDPVGSDGVLEVNGGRNLPLKARAWVDGQAVSGPAAFEVLTCGASSDWPETAVDATWQASPERWMAGLDTTGLAPGCHAVRLVQGASVLGAFTLQVLDSPKASAVHARGSNRPS